MSFDQRAFIDALRLTLGLSPLYQTDNKPSLPDTDPAFQRDGMTSKDSLGQWVRFNEQQ